jgi:RNA polymerase sigma-70 factor, ECF subfamily
MFKDELARAAVTTVSDDDTPLVLASQTGDGAAFEQLVSRYHRKALRVAYHIIRNADDAKDVVQEAFSKVFQHIGQFQAYSSFSTWLYRIVVNQCLMEVRRQRRKPVPVHLPISGSEDEQLPIDLPDWRPNPEEQYAQSELRDFITRLLQELRPRLRVVFIMHNIKGQRLEEVAEALQLTLSTAKSRSLRARLYFRERLMLYLKNDIHKGRTDERW